MNKSRIPKVLHFVWVGDESLLPEAYINSWRKFHPDFEIKIWGNEAWKTLSWETRRHMDAMLKRNGQYSAVADLMRWEILNREGGLALDADSVCIRRLPDWLFDCDIFAAWENEYARPGLVANGYVGARPGHEIIGALVKRFASAKDLSRRFVWYKFKRKGVSAWKATGPVPFTEEINKCPVKTITILPSHFFLPRHYSGFSYEGNGPIYSCELFSGANRSGYSNMQGVKTNELISEVRSLLGVYENT